jgi:hypothetical protein
MAVFRPRVTTFLDGAATALEMDDPWDGFVSYLENMFGMQAGDRGFNDFLSQRFTDSAETEQVHDQMCRQIEQVLTRAREPGEVRADHPGGHRRPHLVQRPNHRRHQGHGAPCLAAPTGGGKTQLDVDHIHRR